jgi:hypothetical protein
MKIFLEIVDKIIEMIFGLIALGFEKIKVRISTPQFKLFQDLFISNG